MRHSHPRGLQAGLHALCALGVALSATPLCAQSGSTPAPLIQGTASLVEPFEASADSELAAIAAVVIETQGALMLTSALTLTETTAVLNTTPTLSELWHLCPGEPFEEQTTAAFCSGTTDRVDLELTVRTVREEHAQP